MSLFARIVMFASSLTFIVGTTISYSRTQGAIPIEMAMLFLLLMFVAFVFLGFSIFAKTKE